MEPNSHYYNGFTQVKEQALPCPGKGLADAQSESVMARDGMPTLPRTQRGRYNKGCKDTGSSESCLLPPKILLLLLLHGDPVD